MEPAGLQFGVTAMGALRAAGVPEDKADAEGSSPAPGDRYRLPFSAQTYSARRGATMPRVMP